MQAFTRAVALGLLSAILLALPAGAQSPVSVTAELAYRSKYLFAGIPFAAEDVTQTTVSVGAGSLTLNGFSSYDHDASDLTEVDFYGDYYTQLAPTVGAFLGGALYNFKIAGVWEATPEIYGGIVVTAPLTPTLYVAHDFDLGDGTHAMLTLTHGVPLGTSGATVDFTGNLEFNDGYYVDTSGFSYVDVGASVSIPAGPVTIKPLVLFQRAIDDMFTDEELFGVSASFTF